VIAEAKVEVADEVALIRANCPSVAKTLGLKKELVLVALVSVALVAVMLWKEVVFAKVLDPEKVLLLASSVLEAAVRALLQPKEPFT
jgi:hypothetical protein